MSLLLHNFVMNYEIIMYKHIQCMHVVCTLMYNVHFCKKCPVYFVDCSINNGTCDKKVSCNNYFLPLKAKNSYSELGLLIIEDACK